MKTASSTTQANVLPMTRRFESRVFNYRGEQWRIFKRSAKTDAPFQFYFERAKQRHGPKSLGTWLADLAIERAKQAIDAFYSGRKEAFALAMGKRSAACCTLGDIFATVPALSINAEDKARKNYLWCARRVLRRALDVATDDALDKLPASVINGDTARKYFVSCLAEAKLLPTQAAANKFKRNALSIFGSCKAIFSPVAADSMKIDFKLSLPATFEAFRQGSKIGAQLLDPGQASEFHAPADAIIRRMLVDWVRLARDPGFIIEAGGLRARDYCGATLPEWLRRNIFITVGLALSCGLRKGEIEQARGSWIKTIDGRARLEETAVDVKNKSNVISVRPLDPFWRVLNFWLDRNGWRPAAGETLLFERPKGAAKFRRLQYDVGGPSDRRVWPFQLIGNWLRSLGWTTQKATHSLRDLGASWITSKYGLERASRWCRHGQIATTQAHYSRFVKDEDMDDPRRLAWLRWAK